MFSSDRRFDNEVIQRQHFGLLEVLWWSLQWPNCHHLLYFWLVAREGSLARATVPKLVARRLLEPALKLHEQVRIACREDKPDRLLAELALHNL